LIQTDRIGSIPLDHTKLSTIYVDNLLLTHTPHYLSTGVGLFINILGGEGVDNSPYTPSPPGVSPLIGLPPWLIKPEQPLL